MTTIRTVNAIVNPGGSRLRAYDALPARSWFLAPPFRLVSEPNGEMLTLYTLQTREAYETLASEGRLVGDASLGWEEFQEAYGWMLREMDRRLPEPSGGLLWLWPTATRAQLRDVARHAPDEVLLTVRVAHERVLLSAFGSWHDVLNRGLHVPLRPGETDEEWEGRATTLCEDFDARTEPYRRLPIAEWPVGLRSEIEASWEAIFDPASWGPNPSLQATMRQIRATDVVRAVRIR